MPTLVWVGKVSEPLFRSPRQSHLFWEVCLYVSGEGEALIGDQRVPFGPGTIICYPPNIPHEEHSSAGCIEYYIGIRDFNPAWTSIPVLRDSPEGAFARLIEQLCHEYRSKEPGWEQIALQLFQVLHAYIDRWRASDQHPVVAQLKHLILQSMCDPEFNAIEAMDGMALCKDHVRRLFVRTTGITPKAYLTALRIEEAKRLLRVLRLGVKETSGQVGFRDPAYFSRVFRKHTGQWPSEFADPSPPARSQDARSQGA